MQRVDTMIRSFLNKDIVIITCEYIRLCVSYAPFLSRSSVFGNKRPQSTMGRPCLLVSLMGFLLWLPWDLDSRFSRVTKIGFRINPGDPPISR